MNKMISTQKLGFINKLRTKDALRCKTNIIYNSINKTNEWSWSILPNLAKAFDTEDYEVLFQTLYWYGIRGNAYKLMKSCLTERKQKVEINTTSSTYKR